MSRITSSATRRVVARMFWTYSPIFLGVALFSGLVNILALAGSFYMLQVYDRVLPSQSVPTLIGLSVLMAGLYVMSGALELIRARIMARVGTRVDAALSPRVFKAIQLIPLRSPAGADGMQPLRDLDQVRNFTSGMGLPALFDLPWMPIFLIFVYFLHPSLALVAVIGALLLVALTVITEYRCAGPLQAAAQSGGQRLALAESARRNAEPIHAMGLSENIATRYATLNDAYLAQQLSASDTAIGLGTVTKTIRLLMQSIVLGLGAYLVILGKLSPGAIIAASISVSRALAPIEAAIGQWKNFVTARQSAGRLNALLNAIEATETPLVALPAPSRTLQANTLYVAPPGERETIIKNVSFKLDAGDALGIIGPSGSGKSTLARALVGIWPPANPAGSVRLDDAALEQWEPSDLGRHIGYMPQDIELFAGTVGDNISRFDPSATSEDIVNAAMAAGSHQMIVRLPDGYQTRVGEGGRSLSGGERQRIALARALYRDPFFVVLDEPNANLDTHGDQALADAITAVRLRGGIAVVIAHRPSALANVNKVLVLQDGQPRAFGPKEDVLKSVLQTVPSAPAHIGASNTLHNGAPGNSSSADLRDRK